MMTLKAHWLVWLLLLLVIYMAITAPSTLGAVADDVGHVLGATGSGISHFLAAVAKKP
jgi:hypothetical protein